MRTRVEYKIGENPTIGSSAFGAYDFDEDAEHVTDADYIAAAARNLTADRQDFSGEPVTFLVIRFGEPVRSEVEDAES